MIRGLHGAISSSVAKSFVPSDLSSLVLELDVNTIIGKSDGDPISSFVSSEGNSYNFTASATKEPTYKEYTESLVLDDSLTNLSDLQGGHGGSWDSQGIYFVAVGIISDSVTLFKRTGDTIAQVDTISSINYDEPVEVKFNKDDDRVVVNAKDSDSIIVFSIDRTLGAISQDAIYTSSTYVNQTFCVAWNFAGDRIVTVSYPDSMVTVLKYDRGGSSISLDVSVVDTTNILNSYDVEFHPDDDRIIIGTFTPTGATPSVLSAWNFTKGEPSTLTYQSKINTGNNLLEISINKDGDTVAVCLGNPDKVEFYDYDKTTNTFTFDISTTTELDLPHVVQFAYTSNRLAVASYTNDKLVIFDYQKSTPTNSTVSLVSSLQDVVVLDQARGVDWTRDDKYLATSSYSGGGNSAVGLFSLVSEAGGNPYINFDGSNDVLEYSTGISEYFHEVFVVCRNKTGGVSEGRYIDIAPEGSGYLILQQRNAAGYAVQSTGDSFGQWKTTNGLDIDTIINLNFQYDATLNSNVPIVRVDDSSKTITVEGSPSGTMKDYRGHHIYIGDSPAFNSQLSGDIWGIWCFNEELSSEDRAKMVNYISNRFGI